MMLKTLFVSVFCYSLGVSAQALQVYNCSEYENKGRLCAVSNEDKNGHPLSSTLGVCVSFTAEETGGSGVGFCEETVVCKGKESEGKSCLYTIRDAAYGKVGIVTAGTCSTEKARPGDSFCVENK